MSSRASGFVSLVGAGPGDAELLTLRAAQRLAVADVVLYDALVDASVLELAPNARRFCVGKRAGRPSVRQETIHRVMIGAARRGFRVVRLKCGDPFVLGRGGEEALALVEAGVSFEVVPGVTTAVAAAELAGIPVTHRGLATGFLVIAGHEERAWRPALESLAPRAVTLVVLMGMRTRAAIAAALLARGWRGDVPAAICLAAGTAAASTWIGTLAELGSAPIEPGDAPGTIVIGDVVSVAAKIVALPDAESLSTAVGE
jgi:uroporphyrin-III C-methyltransferase / precorrin-2 dehydrogenase / sirohydrochlorin ferrochelatase